MQISTLLAVAALLTGGGLAAGALIPTTAEDFRLPGTREGEANPVPFQESVNCAMCHADYDLAVSPYDTWQGSLMGLAAQDPLFWAQLATARQDLANVGPFCVRCHIPAATITGQLDATEPGQLDYLAGDGVACHVCHAMVDPIYKPGISPLRDERVLEALMSDPPSEYGNAMFVLDPEGYRRGARGTTQPPHVMLDSPFHRSGDFCGSCHDVGNVGVERQADGTYEYNVLDAPTDAPMRDLFPLERTYTEWKLSEFANGGVDMGGRFGGDGASVVQTCQDCHMPRAAGRMAKLGTDRPDIARHEFAGASAWVLRIIMRYAQYTGEDRVNPRAVRAGIRNAEEMLAKAVSLQLFVQNGELVTRVVNESGHKLPTGHIEGRRVWVNVRFYDENDALVAERGAYDPLRAELWADDTTVYEMHVGLSASAAAATGLPAGTTSHMALANSIVKDNRIPPRGFVQAAFERAGAPVVGADYADGQHWHDTHFVPPTDARRAKVAVYYQTVSRDYVEALREGNHTDHWGETLFRLWVATDKCPPILMAADEILLP
ncbi:MAG: hypothetical protein H6831_12645 [Planctomycetes bacterium]|nr:hypothetical protein [Planctomycetota bacterium]MCB9905248.1 hypothetical protein [Planctomycetota bacterium]